MNDEHVPLAICKFLEDHIESVAQLEALVLMQNAPSTKWTAAAMSKRLFLAEDEVAAVLAHLHEHRLIQGQSDGYWFDPTPEDLASTVLLLIEQYRTHLIPITRLIHSKPHRIQQFANAFKFRKD